MQELAHRRKIGILAIVLLVAALGLHLAGSENGVYLEYACWRIGAVMVALWLAHPQLERLPPLLMLITMGVLVVVAWRPKTALVAGPILLALWLLRPRGAGPKPQAKN